MKKLSKLIINLCCLSVLLLLFSCNNLEETETTENKTHALVTTLTQTIETYYYDNVAPYFSAYYENGGRFMIAEDRNGKEFYRGVDVNGFFIQFDEDIFIHWISGGNGMSARQYFDVEQGLVSPIYPNSIAAGYGKVVYLDDGDYSMLVVRSMFDPEVERVTFKRNFCTYRDIEVPEADYFVYPFTKAEFIDRNQLHIIYLTVDEEFNFDFVEEILKLD